MRVAAVLAFAGVVFGGAQGRPVERSAAEPTLALGAVRLSAGMDEEEARRRLAVYFDVQKGGFVTTKSGPPFRIVGAVQFDGGKLVRIIKHWDEELDQEGSADIVQRLVDVIGSSECRASVAKTVEPTMRQDALVLRCSPYRVVELTVGKSPGMRQPAVNLREVVSQ